MSPRKKKKKKASDLAKGFIEGKKKKRKTVLPRSLPLLENLLKSRKCILFNAYSVKFCIILEEIY